MHKGKRGFTLIELIIVIVIVGILAMVAIPKYFANIQKAKRAEAVSSMRSIREGLMGYYSVNNAFPAAGTFPFTVVVDGETVLTMDQLVSPNFTYTYTATNVTATKIAGMSTKDYTMSIASGAVTES